MTSRDQVTEDPRGRSKEDAEDLAYEPPRLDVLGSVKELTAGGPNGTFDDFGFTPLS